ncbi:MAG TPA: hypothetical protein VFI96_05335 [Longimicrobiaceae bacterium]|nr:hypothetical protein [Longimicrobiaceae bacterium]
MHSLRDFRPDLRYAVEHLQDAGLVREAYVLTASLERGYSSSREMLNDIGHTVLRLERRLGTDAPAGVEDALERALSEIRKVLPALS